MDNRTWLGEELTGEADTGNSQEYPVMKSVCSEGSWKVRFEGEFEVCLEGAGTMKLKSWGSNWEL